MLKFVVLLLAGAICFACSWDYQIWIPRSASADALYRFVVGEKAGYINRQGTVVIEPRLEFEGNSGGEFHNGLLRDLSGKGQFLDRSGKVVAGENLGSEQKFSEGLAVRRVGEKVGYVGRDGKFVIEPRFSYGSEFRDGMAKVLIEGDCLMFSNEEACHLPTVVGNSLRKGLPHCRFEYIDKSGVVVTNGQFEMAGSFSAGLAPVRVGELWGFINKSGALEIEAQFEEAWPFSEGLARIRQGLLIGYVDRHGKVLIEAQYDSAEDFHEGFAVVQVGEFRFRYIDRSGRYALGGDYEAASPFFKGLAHVSNGKKFFYIDTTGKVVFQY